MEEKKNDGFWLVGLDDWEYEWVGKEPVPKFPYLRALKWVIAYNLKGGDKFRFKGFPKRLYKVLKRLFTNSLKPSQAPSGKSLNKMGSKCGAVS